MMITNLGIGKSFLIGIDVNEKRITFVWKMEREARVGAADVTGEDKRRL
jgi:hypothetical protein